MKYNPPMPDEKAETPSAPQDHLVVTRHTLRLGSEELRYTVTTGTLVLREESEAKGDKEGAFEGEKPRAEVFFMVMAQCRLLS